MTDRARVHSLLRKLAVDAQPEPDVFRLGTVTSVDPLNVQLDGEDDDAGITYPQLGSYAAVVGDRVGLLRTRSTWTVLGSVGVGPVMAIGGEYTGTTDTSGEATVTHGLGFTPSHVFPVNTKIGGSVTAAAGIAVDTTSFTSTQFTVRFGGVSAAAAYSFSVLAFA